VLNCFGERLVTDPGAGTYSKIYWTGAVYHVATIGHSTLLIDREGQIASDVGATIENYMFQDWINYVELELGPVYNKALSARRSFLVLTESLMVMIFDHVLPTRLSARIKWLLHFMGEIKILQNIAIIHVGNAELIVQPLTLISGEGIKVYEGEGDRYLKFRVNFTSAVLLYPVNLNEEIISMPPPVNTIYKGNAILIELNRSVSIDYILFNTSKEYIKIGPISTNGYLCMVTESLKGEVERYALISGNILDFKGEHLIHAQDTLDVAMQRVRTEINVYIKSRRPLKVSFWIGSEKPKALRINEVAHAEYIYDSPRACVEVNIPKGNFTIRIEVEKAYIEGEENVRRTLSAVYGLINWAKMQLRSRSALRLIDEAKQTYYEALNKFMAGEMNLVIDLSKKAARLVEEAYKIERKAIERAQLVQMLIKIILTGAAAVAIGFLIYKWGIPVIKRSLKTT